MFVGMDFGQPRRGGEDADAEFFFKLTLQGLEVGFARFDFAAGKFPISGIGLALPATTRIRGRVSWVMGIGRRVV